MAGTSTAQVSDYQAPRLPGTDNPDLNGVWQALNTANWDIRPHAAGPSALPDLLGAIGAMPAGLGVVEGNEIPYQPWASDKQRENFEGRLTRPLTREMNETTGDPEAKCYMPGVPRATYMPFPFQIFQNESSFFIAYEFAGAVLDIYLQDVGPAETDSWMGQSVGRWDGDTLVVEVTGQNDQTWFDRAGSHHTNQLIVTERYTMIGPNHLQYEATMEDPNVFTEPWTISMPLYRRIESDARLMDFKCVEFVEELLFGEFRRNPLPR